jgi:hypothetical protein
MRLDRSESESDTYVCFDCVGDPGLQHEIKQRGLRRCCSFCKEQKRTVSIEKLAARAEEIYRLIVEAAQDEPTFDADSDKVYWQPRGSSASEIMAEIIECDDFTIAERVVDVLAEENAYAVIKDGDFDWFDDTSQGYVIRLPRDTRFAETWASFRESIQHDRRFFNDTATGLLSEILNPIVRGEWPKNISAIKSITPSSDDRFVYRGRQAIGEDARKRIYLNPIRELAAPPPRLNAAGRMNSAGISTFYGSFESRTCVAELRVPVGGEAVIGKFEIIRSVHEEIKRAVVPGTESLEYLPTQFVAEFLWAHATPRLDGLIYGSSQLSDSSKNIVLFPHATVVEGALSEETQVVEDIFRMSDEDGLGDEVLVIAGGEKEVKTATEANATLRLDRDGIIVSRVTAINVEVDDRRVSTTTSTRDRDFPF